jgi:hypothetical protein
MLANSLLILLISASLLLPEMENKICYMFNVTCMGHMHLYASLNDSTCGMEQFGCTTVLKRLG